MSKRQKGRGREMVQVFQQEWHPDQCQCTQCYHSRQEAQVLRQFENEIDRLEDEVRKTREFTSTTERYIDTESLTLHQSSTFTKKVLEGLPSTKKPQIIDKTRRGGQCLRTNGDSRDWDQFTMLGENLNDKHDNTSADMAVRKRYIDEGDDSTQSGESWELNNGWGVEGEREGPPELLDNGTNSHHLHNGCEWQMEAGDDDLHWGSSLDNHRHRQPSHALDSHDSTEYVYSSDGQQHGESQCKQEGYKVNNEKVYKGSVKLKKKRSLSALAVRLKDTVKRLAALQKSGEDGWKNRVKKESKDVNSNVTLRPKPAGNIRERPVSLMERMSALETSSQQWRGRITHSDATKFTVAHKMASSSTSSVPSVVSGTSPLITVTPEQLSTPTGSPLIERKKRSPCQKVFKSKTGGNLPSLLNKSSPLTPRKDFRRSISTPNDGEKKGETPEGTSVSVPRADDESFNAFFSRTSYDPSQLPEIELPTLEDADFDHISETVSQLGVEGKVKTSANSSKAMMVEEEKDSDVDLVTRVATGLLKDCIIFLCQIAKNLLFSIRL
ncbi:Supervillin-like 1 [Homarus americanus]|uniref:Supervillin-like 1 n=1 Tax=Homarus americanus TaxID=6706 RepID=A0A8J5JV65_HOMAM|nr:Supervillin-like 1 [Homarus americanus]